MIWILMAGMAALAALAAAWPLFRDRAASANRDAAHSEMAFRMAQLAEIQRDVERGLLPQGEAASARAEAARRLLAVTPVKAKGDAKRTPRTFAILVIVIGVPAVAFSLYVALGQPRMPDEPLADRPAGVAEKDIAAAVAGVEAHLLSKPDDGAGWAVLAPVYLQLGRYDEAAHAYSEALRLLGEDPSRRAAYGEALVAAAGGVVTDKARVEFEKGVAEDPNLPQARFYLALAAEQEGRTTDAINAYEALASAAPTGAPWLAVVRARLASLKAGSASAPEGAGVAAATDQNVMIEGMVNRLATRLADRGGDVDEWGRLIRAYTVLHKGDKAKAALADARKALFQDRASVARLDQLARELGLGEAN